MDNTPEKVEKYSDLYISGRDVENYPMSTEVNICSVCFAVVSTNWDHWEKHIEWHKGLLEGLSTEEEGYE